MLRLSLHLSIFRAMTGWVDVFVCILCHSISRCEVRLGTIANELSHVDSLQNHVDSQSTELSHTWERVESLEIPLGPSESRRNFYY